MRVATLIPLVTLSATKLFFSFESYKLTQILQQQQQQKYGEKRYSVQKL